MRIDDTSPRSLDEASRQYLARLFAEHAPRVRCHCRYVLHHDPAVDDAVTETFVAVARNLHKVRNLTPEQLHKWLRTTAHRAALRQVHLRRTNKQVLTGEDIETRANGDDMASLVRVRGIEDRLRRAAETFDASNRRLLPLALRYRDGTMRMADIAGHLQIPETVAKMRERRLMRDPGYLGQALLTVYLADERGDGCDIARQIVDGQPLSPRLREAVVAHAATCKRCDDARENLRGLLGVGGLPLLGFLARHDLTLRDVADARDHLAAPTEASTSGPHESGSHESGSRRSGSRRFAWLGVAAILVLGLVLGFALPGPANRAASFTPVQVAPSHVSGAAHQRHHTSGARSGGKPGRSKPAEGETGGGNPGEEAGAYPPVPRVSLSVSRDLLAVGQTATLRARVSRSLSGSPYVVRIVDQARGTTVRECSAGMTCTAPISFPAPVVQTYTAQIDRRGAPVRMAPDPARVTWSTPRLTLSASPPVSAPPSVDATVRLTAHTSIPLNGSSFVIDINDAQGDVLKVCATGTDCTTTLQIRPGSFVFRACLKSGPPHNACLQTETVKVTWPHSPPSPPQRRLR
jgi:DNA-directed RNA polymerase specialized sigma24 family protein